MSDQELTFASAGVACVHYARCEACMYGACPGIGWHSWAGPEDRIHALKNGQPDPIDKRCACECAEREPDPEPVYDEGLGDGEACPTCGEVGACGYDSEGRALIHATWMFDDEEDE